ncbi:MAG: ATP-binding cassette domain-containing protein [Candidatus Methanomethylicia archaeon]|nr:ATP-binding cassette domain-containing protein [Candidatus Methanomethylicia archaeon]
MKAVEFINVTKTFKGGVWGKKVTALNNISFQLEESESMAVIGPSPSGKTTLLKLTAGIYRPEKGEIKIMEKSIIKDLGWARKNTYYISEQMQLNKKLTIIEEISYFQKIFNKNIDEKCIEMLELAEISKNDFNRRIETLSEMQTTILKMVLGLIKRPKIILIDGILGSLNHEIFKEISKIFKSISGLTMMITDRNIDILNDLCSKVMLLEDGRIIDFGDLKSILLDYPYKYDVELTCKGKIIDRIDVYGYPYQKFGDMIRFHLKNEFEVEDLVKKLLKDMKEKIVSINISGLDIEDVYYWKIKK